MKRFRFRMQPVLDLREMQEDEAARALGEARQAESLEREQLSCLMGLRDSVESEMEASFDPQHAMAYLGYLSRLQGRIHSQQEQVQEMARVAEDRRESLVQASVERRKLEKLKERRQEEHRAEVLAAEEKELDDLRTSRSRRGRAC